MEYKGKNPFEESPKSTFEVYEDDDEKFSSFGNSNSKFNQSPQDTLQQMKQNSINNTLESTQRAMASIYESEQIGSNTAEELIRQGEQLDDIEKKTDGINATMKSTQQDLNGIKSVFGGLRNWWNSKKSTPSASSSPAPKENKLKTQMEGFSERTQSSQHPAFTFKTENPNDFYGNNSAENNPRSENPSSSRTFREISEQDKQIDDNLDLMAGGLSKLKELGLNLGDEIGRQNDQIERITGKSERADTKLRDQNRQMRTILKK